MIIQFFVRTLGPILLRSGGLGGGGTSTPTDNKDDDFDDFDNDDNEIESSSSSSIASEKGRLSINLPTFAPDTEDVPASFSSSTSTTPTKVELFDSFEDESS
jgi:hypothetical protein